MSSAETSNTFEILQDQSPDEPVKEQQEVTSEATSNIIAPEASSVLPVLDEISENESVGKYTATCKWFNDKLGFGFVTICDGEDKGKDIFVHHSGIKPLNSIYKTLKKGEYINFNIVNGLNGLQAVDVTGINGGPLMCDHVTGKKINDFSTNTNNVSAAPTAMWQQVHYKNNRPYSAGVRHNPRNAVQSQDAVVHPRPQTNPVVKTAPGKRYPPNTRPYKRKQPSQA